MTPQRQRLLTLVAALAGIGLFAHTASRTGVAEITDAVRRVGWGLAPVLALGGLRFVVRAAAWRACAPPHARLPFPRALTAFIAGDALGNVTPLGPVASEPTKAFLVRHHLATGESVASLALDNVVYAASVLLMVAVGLVVALLAVPLPFAWREAMAALLAALAVGSAVAIRLARGTWSAARGSRPAWRARLARTRDSVMALSGGQPARLWRVLALDMAFHALSLAELFLVLEWLVGASPTFTQALVLETLNRVVTVGFKFVPFRIGVDEASSGALAPLLGIDPAVGVALAVIRKARNLAWTAIGLALIAAHPSRGRPAPDRP